MSDFRIGTALGRLADAMNEIAKQFERMNDLKERELEKPKFTGLKPHGQNSRHPK